MPVDGDDIGLTGVERAVVVLLVAGRVDDEPVAACGEHDVFADHGPETLPRDRRRRRLHRYTVGEVEHDIRRVEPIRREQIG